MSAIHLVLQGKGGVGKSLVAALLAQYLAQGKAAGQALLCADTDPVNDTFARYGAFGAQRIKILNADKNIDARAFDGLIESVLAHEGNCVIDNGASTFIPLSAYLRENSVVELLQASGGRTSSRVTSRHFDHSKARRAFISRSNRPYGLTCSQINGVRAA